MTKFHILNDSKAKLCIKEFDSQLLFQVSFFTQKLNAISFQTKKEKIKEVNVSYSLTANQ